MKIAQRFNAGIVVERLRVPKGRLNPSAFQSSLRDLSQPGHPSVETLGYFRLSLRDRGAGLFSEFLAALDILVRSKLEDFEARRRPGRSRYSNVAADRNVRAPRLG